METKIDEHFPLFLVCEICKISESKEIQVFQFVVSPISLLDSILKFNLFY